MITAIQRIIDDTPVINKSVNDEPAKPPMWAIWLHNDNSTMPYFVTRVLEAAFGIPSEDAGRLMFAVHQSDRGLVKVCTRDLADTQLGRAEQMIRNATPGIDYGRHAPRCELTFTLEPAAKGD